MLGSYIGIVTATIVLNIPKVPVLNELPTLIFWFLPTIIGTTFIYKIGENYKISQEKILEPYNRNMGTIQATNKRILICEMDPISGKLAWNIFPIELNNVRDISIKKGFIRTKVKNQVLR